MAGEVSRGHSGRCARCRPVVRFLHRAVFREVVEDRADGGGFFDTGDDAHRAAAVDAGFHVDTKHALEALRPVIERRFSSGVWWSLLAPVDASSVVGRLLRSEAVSCARKLAFDAKTQ